MSYEGLAVVLLIHYLLSWHMAADRFPSIAKGRIHVKPLNGEV